MLSLTMFQRDDVKCIYLGRLHEAQVFGWRTETDTGVNNASNDGMVFF